MFLLLSADVWALGSEPAHPCMVGRAVYFTADDGIHGRELWRYSTDEGCVPVADLQPGHEGSAPACPIAVGKYLYFQTTSPSYGSHLCFIDSTSNHLANVTKTMQLLDGTQILEARATEAHVYFLLAIEERILEIWRTGVGAHTAERLYSQDFTGDIRIDSWRIMKRAADQMTFNMGDHLALWNDNSKEGRPYAAPEGCRLFRVLDSAPGNDHLYVLLDSDDLGIELYRLSMNTGEWVLLKDIFPGPTSSNISTEIMYRGLLLFTANDRVHGTELWRSDGTPEGTMLIADIAQGSASSNPYKFCSVGEILYFVADNDLYGSELWRTDGTGEGTRLVCDLTPGAAGTGLWSLAAFQDRLLFCAESQEFGEELFMTSGTAETTQIIKDIVPGKKGSGPHNITPFGTQFFFTCDDGFHGEEPWISDGTAAGTRLAADIAAKDSLPKSSNPALLTPFNDSIVFSANDDLHGREPWISDGTETGTRLLCDIAPGKSDSNPEPFIPCGDHVYFTADFSKTAKSLWKTAGTPDTTALAFDSRTGAQQVEPGSLLCRGRDLFFISNNPKTNAILWRLKDNTEIAENVLPLPTSSSSWQVTFSLWGTVYLVAFADNQHPMVCRLEETTEAPLSLRHLPGPVSDFETFLEDYPSGTEPLELQDGLAVFLAPLMAGASPAVAWNASGILFFVMHTPRNGVEIWKTDGTRDNTQLIRDIYPGPASSSPDRLTLFNERLYFIAETPDEGRVLFVSDGTSKNTTPLLLDHHVFVWPPLKTVSLTANTLGILAVTVMPPRAGISGPLLLLIPPSGGAAPLLQLPDDCRRWAQNLAALENRFFFVYQDDRNGKELWTSDATREGTRLVKDINPPRDLP